jgi:F-type H+-transporting ATPase subunit epsilon
LATTFRCTIVTPARQVFDEQIAYASIPAWDGLQGVMQNRAPMVVRLTGGPLRLDAPDGRSRWFYLGDGFAQMKDNNLSLLADEAVPADEALESDAQNALKTAENHPASNPTDALQKQKTITRARTLLQLAQKK